jgi:hypothetical protein
VITDPSRPELCHLQRDVILTPIAARKQDQFLQLAPREGTDPLSAFHSRPQRDLGAHALMTLPITRLFTEHCFAHQQGMRATLRLSSRGRLLEDLTEK